MNSGQNQKGTGTEPGTHGCENYIAACQNLIIRHAVIYIMVIEEPQSGLYNPGRGFFIDRVTGEIL